MEQLTGDQLAARLFAEQGYFVMYSDYPLRIEAITTEDEYVMGREPVRLPFRIVGQSNREEYTDQRRRTSEITGYALDPFPSDAHYFYRCEAAD